MHFAVLNSDGVVWNTIVLDEESDYDPGEGFSLENIADTPQVTMGWRLSDSEWIPGEPESITPPLSNDDIIVTLQASVEYLQQQIDILLLESLG